MSFGRFMMSLSKLSNLHALFLDSTGLTTAVSGLNMSYSNMTQHSDT